jgi:hypothetical protein
VISSKTPLSKDSVPLTVHVVDARPFQEAIYFDLSITFGTSLSWMVHHTFDEFVEFHEDLWGKYGAQIPALPKLRRSIIKSLALSGEVSEDVESFKEDLETYLRVIVASSAHWAPTVYNVKVQHPDDRKCDRVKVNSCLFDFFAMAEPLSISQEVQGEVLNAGNSTPLAGAELSSFHGQDGLVRATLLDTLPQESSRHVGYEDLSLAAAARDITSQIRVSIEDFTIYLGDHIDYHIRVNVWGHQWVLSKRYSELEELHEALRGLYGKDQVPSFSASRVASWRKLDRKTGILRQKFFANYLNDVIVGISTWDPLGLFCTVELMRTTDGLRSKVEVTVNNFLFDFFCFKDHIALLSGDDAMHAIEGQQASLPEETAQAFAFQRRTDRRDRLRHAIEAQGRSLQSTTAQEIQQLQGAFHRLKDDKDIIRLFEHFLISGEIANDIQDLDAVVGPRLVTVNSPSTMDSARFPSPQTTPRARETSSSWENQTPVKGTQRRFVLDKDVCDAAIQKGLTSSQVLQLIEPISFNDTKIAVLRLFTPALVEMSDLQLVFDALWFDWDKTRVEVEDLLLAEKAIND